jgi:branched-chain amino acid aminotransferase
VNQTFSVEEFPHQGGRVPSSPPCFYTAGIIKFVTITHMKIRKVETSKLQSIDLNEVQFGKTMTDHMVISHYKNGSWSEPEIVPYQNLSLSPATSALHYGQSVFEGMSTYPKDDKAVLFRIKDHAERINKSLERLAMPTIPTDLFTESITELIRLEKNWIPKKDGSYLYIRPFVFATDEYVGVRPSSEYTFIAFCSPTGPYYSKKLKVKVETSYSRAAPGGVGFAKAAGNYAASLLATKKAQEEGFDQLIWTDPREHKYIEESGTMNLFCVINGVLVTPSTSETILAGITRDSLCTLAREMNITIEERKISIDELTEAIKNKTLQAMFGSGTAATITEIESVTVGDFTYTIPEVNTLCAPLFKRIKEIKHGDVNHDWVTLV